jgi:hypothetical protein
MRRHLDSLFALHEDRLVILHFYLGVARLLEICRRLLSLGISARGSYCLPLVAIATITPALIELSKSFLNINTNSSSNGLIICLEFTYWASAR